MNTFKFNTLVAEWNRLGRNVELGKLQLSYQSHYRELNLTVHLRRLAINLYNTP